MNREDVLIDNNQENIETGSPVSIDNDKDRNDPVENTTNQDSEYKQSEIDKVSSQTGEYLVCQGATCLCDQGEKIHLELNVLSNKKVFLNDSSALATIDDNVLKGNFSKCKLNPSSGKPCVYQPKNKWDWKSGIQDYYSEVNGKKYLTDHAILQCPMFPGIITVSYNGQEIDVPESDKEDLDSSIDSSIICLMDDHVEPTDEQKKKKPNITSLSVLINEKSINSQSQNIKKIYLRKDKEYEFTATDKKNVGYNYWYVREKQDTDTNPKELPFFVDKGSVYEQTGSKAKFTFKQNGIFYLEAFGTLANKKKIYTDCAFEIEVVDKNKINDIKLTPTERERQDKTKLLLDKNTLYTIELQTLLPIEDEDLEGLSVEVHDTSIRFIPPGAENLPLFKGKDAMRFALKTSDWGSYSLQIKRGKDIIKEYSFPIVENEVKKVHIIDPKVGNEHWVRPGTYVTFEAELSDNKDERKRIYWKLDTSDIPDEHDKRWKHLFSRTADYTVKASYRGFLGMGSSNTGSCSVIVKPNKIKAVKADKNTQSICIGTDVTFSVDTPYIDLIDREYIEWELEKRIQGASLPGKKMTYSLRETNDLPESNLDSLLSFPKMGNPLDNIKSTVKLGDKNNTKKDLKISFNELGIFSLTASMGGKPFETPTIINVVKAHIESWYFCDKEGNKRSKIGWGQDFSIRVKINGCEGRHLKIAFWYDSRSKNINNRFYKIDSGVEQQDLALGKEGIQTWKISSPSLWTSLQNLVKEHGSSSKSEYARIMFTISEIDTLCDNNKEYKKEHPLYGHIFPQKVDNTTASIPNTTEYKALFLDSSKKNPLTDIISYTDQAYISLQRINSPEDTEAKNLEIRLIENRPNKDLNINTEPIDSFDKEGYFIRPVPMGLLLLTSSKQAITTPRFFYLQLYDKVAKKIIYTYPEGYKTGKNNDGEIIVLQKDDYTVEDIKKEPAQEVVVSSAKYIHNINQILLSEKDKKGFDESKLNNQTADQKNQTAQKQNKETIDKSKNYFLQLKVAQDPTIQKSRYIRTGKQVGESSGGVTSDCGGKYCITKDNYKSYKFGTPENVGKLIQEINIRLAGFGGNVPTTEFDNRTEDTIKQFQRDYMNITPTGKICGSLLSAIDEFSSKFIESIKDYTCLCIPEKRVLKENKCPGFGKGLKNENPGMHRSLLWSVSALNFYFSKQNEYTIRTYSAGYRCWAHNKIIPRTSTNHMGKAVDIQFNKGSWLIAEKKEKNLIPLRDIRDKFYIKYLNAEEGWSVPSVKNVFRMEPIGVGKDESYSWIHLDVTLFELKYRTNDFFVKEQSGISNQSMMALAKSLNLSFICSCAGKNDIVSSSPTNESACSHCKIFEKTANPIKREAYYREVGSIMINYMESLNVTNKFKGLYMLAQRRTENGFELNTPLNNPMNLKMQGDLGRTDLMTKETEKNASGVEVTTSKNQSFASFSTEKVGFETYIRQLKKNWENSYKALIDEDKTIENFSYPLQYEGRIGVYGTGIPKYGLDAVATYKREVEDNFKNILSNYKAWYECMLTCPNHKGDKEEIKRDLILLNRLK